MEQDVPPPSSSFRGNLTWVVWWGTKLPSKYVLRERRLNDSGRPGRVNAIDHHKIHWKGCRPCSEEASVLVSLPSSKCLLAWTTIFKLSSGLLLGNSVRSGVARGLLQGRPLQFPIGWGAGVELTKSWPTPEQNLALGILCFFLNKRSYKIRLPGSWPRVGHGLPTFDDTNISVLKLDESFLE